MTDVKGLKSKRAGLVQQGREITERSVKEGRAMTAEETNSYDQIVDEINKLGETLDRVETQRKIALSLAEQGAAGDGGESPEGEGDGGGDAPAATETDGVRAFRSFLRGQAPRGREAEAWRSLQADSDVSGGFVKTPKQIVDKLIKAVDDALFIREFATVYSVTSSDSLGMMSLDNDLDDAEWTSEVGETKEDTALAFGGREMKPNALAKLVKISKKLLEVSAINVEDLVLQRLAYKFAVTQEKHFLLGNGANQPLGIFHASKNGISTTRDIATGNEATKITFDGLINAKYALKSQYHKNARWMFHRNAVAQIMQLKDGENRYIWNPSVVTGQPDAILNLPVSMSEYVPSTLTTGKYVGALADFTHYAIAERKSIEFQRLNELFATRNRVGIIARAEIDGMPTLEEAFVRVKLG